MIKTIICFAFGCLLMPVGFSQRVGIGISNPIAKLSIDSGLNIDQSNMNGAVLESALTFGNNKKVGIGSRRTAGSNQAGLDFYTQGQRRMSIDSFGNVGIGIVLPTRDLHVSGTAYASTYVIAGSGISAGLGNELPASGYDLHTVIGYFTTRVGIGTIPNSAYLLDIGNGSVRFQGALRIEGILNPNNALTIGNNTTIQGTATIEGAATIGGNTSVTGNMIASGIVRSEGRGVVKGTGSSMQRMERMQIALSTGVLLAPGASVNSAEYFYNNGAFSGTPVVLIGQLLVSSGGEAAQVQFVPFSVNNISFRIRVFNHGSNSVSLTATYEVLVVGPD